MYFLKCIRGPKKLMCSRRQCARCDKCGIISFCVAGFFLAIAIGGIVMMIVGTSKDEYGHSISKPYAYAGGIPMLVFGAFASLIFCLIPLQSHTYDDDDDSSNEYLGEEANRCCSCCFCNFQQKTHNDIKIASSPSIVEDAAKHKCCASKK